jgi:hypothetical protein
MNSQRRQPSGWKAHLFVGNEVSPLLSSNGSLSSADSLEPAMHAEVSYPTIIVYTTKQVIDRLLKFCHKIRKDKGDTRAAWRMSRYIRDHPLVLGLEGQHDDDEMQLPQVIEAAMVSALRSAGETNDYRLILQLVSNGIVLANNNPLLTSRVFGEAVHAMAATQANVAKLKSIWKIAVASNNEGAFPATYRAEPLAAYELNLYLKALASRGKSKACVDLFQRYVFSPSETEDKASTMTILPDAHTISTLFSILTESIDVDPKACDPVEFSLNSVASSSSSLVDLYRNLASLTSSTCWQWNAAVEILGMLAIQQEQDYSTIFGNHVYSALLKLQIRAQKKFDDHQNGSQLTVAILEDMMQKNVIPDIVTCTLAIMAMGQVDQNAKSPYYSRRNDEEEARTNLAVNFLHQMQSDTRLPSPNRYSYSAAIMACARQKNHQMALFLLEEMWALGRNDTSLHPNTLCYNQVILSLDDVSESTDGLVTARKRKQFAKERQANLRERTRLALFLLNRMYADVDQFKYDTMPDVVTYNTIFSVGQFPYQDINQIRTISALNLLDDMFQKNIPRDVITYRNAILASSESNETLAILQKCTKDDDFMRAFKRGRVKEMELTTVFNTGLSEMASTGDYKSFRAAVLLMSEQQVPTDSDTVAAIILLIGKSRNGKLLLRTLELFGGGDGAAFPSKLEFSISNQEETDDQNSWDDNDASQFVNTLSTFSFPSLQDLHYTRAIEACLKVGDLANACNILALMKDGGWHPSIRCMEGFAVSYAKAATDAAKRKPDIAVTRAQSAYKIVMALAQPQLGALGVVARACAMTGQWKHARSVLRLIHASILKFSNDSRFSTFEREVRGVKKIHTTLLRECARQGNLSAAMFYTSDIQDFAKKYRNDRENLRRIRMSTDEVLDIEEVSVNGDDFFPNIRNLSEPATSTPNFGMRAQDWIILIQTASKVGDWRVCFNSLQFLRTYAARSKPPMITEAMEETDTIDQRYEELAPALTSVVRCLESHSQEAWACRAIQDWVEWSGRKPPAEAVLAAIRVLASKGLAEEVKGLIDMCHKKNLGHSTRKGVGYEERILIGAVTSFHLQGLYDDADEVFMSAISSGSLPFNFFGDANGQHVLDLHGLNVALSHSAVRIAMRQHAAELDNSTETSDMIIVTGRGRNSAAHLRPILRPEVQRMLIEEFYPPLNTLSVAGNMGALQVIGRDIQAWQWYQQEQKGARMLELASLLRNISNSDRLKASIVASIRATDSDKKDNGPN